MKKTTLLRAVSVLLLLALITVFAACDSNKLKGSDFIDSVPEIPSGIEVESSAAVESDPEPAEGQARMPVIKTTSNITAGVIVVTGTCDEGLSVRISGGEKEVTVKSLDGYFVAQVSMTTTTVNVFEAVAFSDELTESEVRSFDVRYDATADKRVDGYGVTVGSDSYLVFDSAIDDYLGNNLLSQTDIKAFKTFVNNKCSNLKNRAGDYPASMVYVLIPDSVSIYPDRLPEGIVRESYKTRLQYVSEALAETNAVLIDMTDIFMAEKDTHLLYQNTDSHLTEYGAYLVYSEICKVMAQRHPSAAARSLSEFTEQTSTVLGGDLVYYAGADREVVTENVTRYIPKFSLKLGKWDNSDVNISDLKKYAADGDARLATGTGSATQRIIFKTGRTELPSALIYRDDNSALMLDILAERFNNVMFGKSGDYTVNMTDAQRYTGSGQKTVDYVFVIVSESNIASILK